MNSGRYCGAWAAPAVHLHHADHAGRGYRREHRDLQRGPGCPAEKPLPYPHPKQLIGIWHTAPGINLKELNIGLFLYFVDRDRSITLQDIGAYDGDAFNITGAGEPEHVRGLDVRWPAGT